MTNPTGFVIPSWRKLTNTKHSCHSSKSAMTFFFFFFCTFFNTFSVELWTNLHCLYFWRTPQCHIVILYPISSWTSGFYLLWCSLMFPAWRIRIFEKTTKSKPERVVSCLWKVLHLICIHSFILKATEYICLRRAIIPIKRPFNSPCVPEQSVFSIKEPVPHNSVWFYANDMQRIACWKLLFSRTS